MFRSLKRAQRSLNMFEESLRKFSNLEVVLVLGEIHHEFTA